tara:strand:- start:2402 stop:2770 length:369 start_codon:yes stop_codon:yes gene_type:complete
MVESTQTIFGKIKGWSETVASAAGTITDSHAAEDGKRHGLTAFQIISDGAVNINILDGSTSIWNGTTLLNIASGLYEFFSGDRMPHLERQPLWATTGNKLEFQIASATTDLNYQGVTEAITN